VRLLLIRHGQTSANVVGAVATAIPGPPLTELGQAQAAAVPAALESERVDAIHVSRLVRTQLTAEPLARERRLAVQVTPGLEEVPAGSLEMRSDHEGVEAYVHCLAAWMARDLDRAMPGGADGHTFWRRYDDALAGIAGQHRPEETVAVFSHGAAIRVYTALATQMPVEQAYELRLANTGMAVLAGDPASGWRLQAWHAGPLGGTALLDVAALDVTGESAEDVDDDA
jgi:broad specificity phosphatase PhoE